MRIIVVISLIVILFSNCLSQSNFNSLNDQVDARSLSMGESFVALSNSSSGCYYNPATLSGMQGITTSYNTRYYNIDPWFDHFYLSSWNGAVGTKYGSFGFFYNRFHWGEMIVSTPSHPEGDGKIEFYDHTYGLSYANEFYPQFHFGITFKTYNYRMDYTVPSSQPSSPDKITQPYLLDFGFLYRHQRMIISDKVNDEFSAGLSLQNFGTDYRINGHYNHIPHYARLGFAYTFNLLTENEYKLQPFRFIITGEYSNHLNLWETSSSQKDYWKAGMEVTFYEIVSLRMGGIAHPYESFYSYKGLPAFRYGFGLNLPIRFVGVKEPLEVAFDFAAIPLGGWHHVDEKTLSAFTLELKYTKELF